MEMSTNTPADESTDDELTGTAIYAIPEPAAERAVERFREKAAAADAGEACALSDRYYIQDALLDEVDDTATYLIDGEPLGSWLNGRIDRMVIDD